MEKLIDNQTIDFDTHRAGDRQEAGIDGLHMHKRMNGKRFKGIDVLIPLDDKDEIQFRPRNTKDAIKGALLSEVRHALSKDPLKRKALVDTIIDVIGRYSARMDQNERDATIRTGAERIAQIFSKRPGIESEMRQHINDRLSFVITGHYKDDGSLFYIKQDFRRGRVKIGDDIEDLNKGNANRIWSNVPADEEPE